MRRPLAAISVRGERLAAQGAYGPGSARVCVGAATSDLLFGIVIGDLKHSNSRLIRAGVFPRAWPRTMSADYRSRRDSRCFEQLSRWPRAQLAGEADLLDQFAGNNVGGGH